MKKLMCVAAFVFCIAVSSVYAGNTANWTVLSPNGETFSISFPGDPTIKTKNTADVHNTRYMLVNDSVIYMFYVLEYPDDTEVNPEAGLDATVEGLVKGANGELISQKSRKGVHPCRDFEVTVRDGKGTIHGRSFLIKSRVYIMIVTAPSNEVVSEKVEAFFDSFKLKE